MKASVPVAAKPVKVVKPTVPLAGLPLPKADTVKIGEVEKDLSNRLDAVEKVFKDDNVYTRAKFDCLDAQMTKVEADQRSINAVVHKNQEDMSARFSRMEGLCKTYQKCSKAFFQLCLIVS